jgi:predicted Zn-dependent protease
MAGLLSTLARLDEASGSSRGVPNWALTHPPAADRVARVEEAVAGAASPSATATNPIEFDRLIDGVVIGDSREKGFVRGADFLHPVLRFALRFPSKWSIRNSDDQVTAQESDAGDVGLVLRLVPNPSGSLDQTARATMTKAGFSEVSGRRATVNGLNAYVGTYEATVETTRIVSRAAHIQAGDRIYLVAGLSTANQFRRVDGAFEESIGSFRELTRAEADRLQPDRLDFHVVRSGDTWESLARRADGRVRASALAIMNGADPASAPRPGDRVRIVIGG